MAELASVTLPESVTAVANATAAAELVLYDEQSNYPGGSGCIHGGITAANVSLTHDETVSVRLDTKLEADDTYIEGALDTVTVSATETVSPFEIDITGLRFFRVVAVIGGTNQGEWAPFMTLTGPGTGLI